MTYFGSSENKFTVVRNIISNENYNANDFKTTY